jgi:tetratricopeptide (TPR) repeat protein
MGAFETTWSRLPSSGRGIRIVLTLASLILSLGITFGQERSLQFTHDPPLRPDRAQPLVTLNALQAPKPARSAVEKARQATLKGKLSEAHKQLDRALRIYPNYADALMVEGIVNAAERNFDLAEQNLKAAINIDPLYGAPYVPLASIYNDRGQYADALHLLNRAMHLMPSYWLVYVEVAYTEIRKQHYEAALRHLERAAGLQPRNARPNAQAMMHLLKAYVFMEMGDQMRAMPEFQATIKAEPDGAYATRSRQELAAISGHH